MEFAVKEIKRIIKLACEGARWEEKETLKDKLEEIINDLDDEIWGR